MHRSVLSNIVIDVDDLEKGAQFWSQALGLAIEDRSEEGYISLEEGPYPISIGIQRVPEPKSAKSRVHLDIRSDDQEAEIQRLEKLGARRVKQIETWWWMEDPFGNEFCILRGKPDQMPAHSKTWK